MLTDDYPELYGAANVNAMSAQKTQFRLILSRIGILLGIAIVSAFSWDALPSLRSEGLLVVVILLILGLVLGLVERVKRYDRSWFVSRSVAESVKSQTWFYMMRSAPYDGETKVANIQFLENLKLVLKREEYPPVGVLTRESNAEQITEFMRRLRESDFDSRKKLYMEDRVREQRKWYSAKARGNEGRESWYFFVAVALQAGAAMLTFLLILNGPYIINIGKLATTLNPIGVLTTLTAGVLTWSQSRRYGELARSYSLISGGLAVLVESVEQCDTEDALQQVVLDVERTISREHEIWLTRSLTD